MTGIMTLAVITYCLTLGNFKLLIFDTRGVHSSSSY